MAFSSLLFVLVFLPVFLIVYRFMPDRRKENRLLLIFSLIFYAFGGLKYLVLLLIMSAIGWIAGRFIEVQDSLRLRKLFLIITLVIFIAVLVVYKYTGFFLGIADAVIPKELAIPEIIMPLGISFYVFKLISYEVDVYRGDIESEASFPVFLIYTASFHHVLQGPIIRYGEIVDEMYDRKVSYAGMANGIYRFCIGLSKKVILADHVGAMAQALSPVGAEAGSVAVTGFWLGSICYTLQIFLDFSAYTDMAIGLGEMIGFHYPENFNYPYIADSVRDFWRRWHITLSSFFRDYVYIPLGGNRRGSTRRTINLLVVWLLTGLWHGSSWNFVLWGLFYFGFIVLENHLNDRGGMNWPAPLKHIYTLLVVNLGWILFRFEKFADLGRALIGMIGIGANGFINNAVTFNVRNNLFFLIFAILACTPFFKFVGGRLDALTSKSGAGKQVMSALRTVAALLLLIWSVFAMVGNTYTPFLYNQF